MTLPVTVLGGYLGAGKTTLLNHLLRHAGGRRIAVLVNDFGDIAIDAALIESRDGDLMSLAGGCVCCSFGSDLVGALGRLAQRNPAPDHAVIETSGVALPAAVAAAVTLVPQARPDAIVVAADATGVRERAGDRYVGDVVAAQLAAADLLVLAKRDLVDATDAARLHRWLRAAAPQAPVVEAWQGAVPPELLLGPGPVRSAGEPPGRLAGRPAGRGRQGGPLRPGVRPMRPLQRPAASRFVQASRPCDDALDPHRLAAALAALAASGGGLLRAKAIVRDGEGVPQVVQLAGTRAEVVPFASDATDRGKAAPAPGLVCIGLRGRLDEAAIDAALAASRA